MTKGLAILTGCVILAFIVAIWIGANALRCTPPCIQMTEVERSTQRWRWTALVLYLIICFYDFLFVPVWYGINRPDISAFMEVINSTEDTLVQLELMKKLTGQHSPFTLMGGGLFHLAFGAILTGSAVGLNKQESNMYGTKPKKKKPTKRKSKKY